MGFHVIIICGIVYLIAFLATVFFVPFSIRIARMFGAIDMPGKERKIHKNPIPRLGGIAMFIGFTLSFIFIIVSGITQKGHIDKSEGIVLIEFFRSIELTHKTQSIIGAFIGGALIFIFGLIDDFIDLSPKIKLLGQIVAASISWAMGVRITFLSVWLHFGMIDTVPLIMSYIITVMWIVAITNTINLIDGLDGLAAGVVSIASLCIAYIAYIFGYYLGTFPMIAIAGASLGFLIFNFYPAKTFMGDCGSQFLGFVLATFSILGTVKTATAVAILIPMLALSLPIFDTVFAIIRRFLNKKPVMQADKGHLHHRLLNSGLGQRRTVVLIYGICGIMGTAAVLFSRGLFIEMFGLLGVAAVYIYVVLTNPNAIKPNLISSDEKVLEEEKEDEYEKSVKHRYDTQNIKHLHKLIQTSSDLNLDFSMKDKKEKVGIFAKPERSAKYRKKSKKNKK